MAFIQGGGGDGLGKRGDGLRIWNKVLKKLKGVEYFTWVHLFILSWDNIQV